MEDAWIRKLLAEAVQSIAGCDYPEKWPGLLGAWVFVWLLMYVYAYVYNLTQIPEPPPSHPPN